MSCIFCDIIAGKAEASIVYEDELVVAFMDLYPINPGHVLVVPRVHYEHLSDIPEDTGAALFRATQRIERAIWKLEPRCLGTNLLQSNGKDAGQEIFHAHMHIIPRFANDSFRFKFNAQKPGRTALNEKALEIKSLLD
jgi:diadenosine tetraphosphate (Ap4A) HIT family hydrolase